MPSDSVSENELTIDYGHDFYYLDWQNGNVLPELLKPTTYTIRRNGKCQINKEKPGVPLMLMFVESIMKHASSQGLKVLFNTGLALSYFHWQCLPKGAVCP